MIRVMVGKYYNEPDDDLILTPALVFGDANHKDLKARGIALVWIRYSIGISWYFKSFKKANRLQKTDG